MRMVPGPRGTGLQLMRFNNPTQQQMKIKNMTTRHLKKSIGRSPLRLGSLFIPLVLAWLALSPTTQAVSPPPDGGYPNNNTAEGDNALFSLTTGFENTAIGFHALYSNTQGRLNTGNGSTALQNNRTGANNTAIGARTLSLNTTGNDNTATGIQALMNNNGDFNTATGSEALVSNSTGSNNTAHGFQGLVQNTTGSNNTANGANALFSNTTGGFNTGIGFLSLRSNTTTSFNTAIGAATLLANTANANTATGAAALLSNTTGPGNTANGTSALLSNTTGSGNTAIGSGALLNSTTGSSNTGIGRQALYNNTTGDHNIALGQNAGQNLTTGGENIDIGNDGVAGESGTIRIGQNPIIAATFIAGISGAMEGGDIQAVYINTNTGQLGTQPPSSSRRFKKEIKPMDRTSEAILGLKPVSFQYKSDSKGTPQFGLIAEEVAKVNPDLVVRDRNGEIYSVRYEAVNAMLLNEFLKEHREVQQQKAAIAEFKKEIANLTATLKEQAAQIQKVSAQLEMNKPAPQTVLNNQ